MAIRDWTAGILVLTSVGCGSDAVGVEACREIETARCEAAKHCGLVEDVTGCQRFARDHCLHGVELEEAPGTVAVRHCVKALEGAGRCAKKEGPSSPASSCEALESSAKEICDVVLEPERADACRFLALDNEPEPESEREPEPEPTDSVDAGDNE